MKKTTLMLLGMALAVGAQADVVYQDTFDNDGLGTNAGIGGGAATKKLAGSLNNPYWTDAGNANFVANGSSYRNAALLYSSNSFQSTGGFELSVTYFAGGINNSGRNLFSFGLLENASSHPDNVNPFVKTTTAYGIGANVIYHANSSQTRGLWMADGTSNTLLDQSGSNQEFLAGTNTTVVMNVKPDGSGGADWSYSIAGVEEASGNIAAFDFSKSFNFAAFGQDNEHGKRIASVTLDAIPEPAALTLVALTGLGFLYLKRRFS